MNLNEYYATQVVSLAEQEALENRLKLFLTANFSQSLADELFKIFKQVKIEEKNRKDDVVAMTYPGKKIVLNTHVFYSLNSQEQVEFLTHELIHMAISKGNVKLKLLNRAIWKFYNKNKETIADISSIMVGQARVSKRWVNKNEVMSYLVTDPIRWQYLKPGCKPQLIKILEKSNLLKLNSTFWKQRLGI